MYRRTMGIAKIVQVTGKIILHRWSGGIDRFRSHYVPLTFGWYCSEITFLYRIFLTSETSVRRRIDKFISFSSFVVADKPTAPKSCLRNIAQEQGRSQRLFYLLTQPFQYRHPYLDRSVHVAIGRAKSTPVVYEFWLTPVTSNLRYRRPTS